MKIPKAIRRLGRPIKRLVKSAGRPAPSAARPKSDVRLAVLTDNWFVADRDDSAYPESRGAFNRPPRYLLNKLIMAPAFPFETDVFPIESFTRADEARRLEKYTCVIVHICKSVRPGLADAILEKLPPGIRIMNLQVRDVRKRQMGEIIGRSGFPVPEVGRNSDPDTPVFIKSNWNSGDAPEKVYRQCRLGEVPDEVWENPDLTVQRFFEERVTSISQYRRMRRFVIVAGEILQQEFLGTEPKIKTHTSPCIRYSRDIRCMPRDLEVTGRQNTSLPSFHYYDTDEKTRRISQRVQKFASDIGLDIGAIDTITPADGATYIIDVNPTPYQRNLPEAMRDIFADALVKQIEESRQGGQ